MIDDVAASCFLVEWYQGEPIALSANDVAERLRRAAAVSTEHLAQVTLMMVVAVPNDHTLFAVFAASSAAAVIHACQHTGWPVDRISSDVHPWLTSGHA